jgi:hypothetical protein
VIQRPSHLNPVGTLLASQEKATDVVDQYVQTVVPLPDLVRQLPYLILYGKVSAYEFHRGVLHLFLDAF